MTRVSTVLLFVCLNVGLSYGMKCSFKDTNILTEIFDSCPGPLDSSDNKYCCYDLERSKTYCCGLVEFYGKTLCIIILVVAIVCAAVSCCISCLCCRCCPWYRRRHQGTIYGKVQVPTVVHVIQSAETVPQPTPHYTNTAYASSSAGTTEPPSYTEVVYEKQAPYNPNYVSHVQQ